MKKIILLFILLSMQVFPVTAQIDSTVRWSSKKSDGEIKTLFSRSDHRVKVGFYIGPDAAYTQFKDRNVFLVGMSMGVIIDHFFSVGLAGCGIVNSRNLWYNDIKNGQGAYLYGGYGGLKMEFRILPSSPVHINFPILIGGGGLVYNSWTYRNNNNYQDGESLDWDSFFVVEPGVMVELNLLKFMRLDLGLSYRYVPDLDLMNTSSGLVNNFNANIGLRFGKF
ncbi:MAG: hypothetical protein M0P58_04290 [Bacteroidales bacterium]|jgi:hypothetical protein|nr:hypothetical protein [Bacteroidales bacterium]